MRLRVRFFVRANGTRRCDELLRRVFSSRELGGERPSSLSKLRSVGARSKVSVATGYLFEVLALQFGWVFDLLGLFLSLRSFLLSWFLRSWYFSFGFYVSALFGCSINNAPKRGKGAQNNFGRKEGVAAGQTFSDVTPCGDVWRKGKGAFHKGSPFAVSV